MWVIGTKSAFPFLWDWLIFLSFQGQMKYTGRNVWLIFSIFLFSINFGMGQDAAIFSENIKKFAESVNFCVFSNKINWMTFQFMDLPLKLWILGEISSVVINRMGNYLLLHRTISTWEMVANLPNLKVGVYLINIIYRRLCNLQANKLHSRKQNIWIRCLSSRRLLWQFGWDTQRVWWRSERCMKYIQYQSNFRAIGCIKFKVVKKLMIFC